VRKKLWILGGILCFLCTLFAMKSMAHTVASGTLGENLTWTLDDTGKLTVKGTGCLQKTSWGEMKKRITSVEIADGVTSIGTEAFYGCERIASVKISETVKAIDSHAFGECYSLVSVDMPNSITHIGPYAFYRCISLTNINFSTELKYIGEYAFSDCRLLAGELVFPENLEKLEDCSFACCRSLASVVIPSSTVNVSFTAFESCDMLTKIQVSEDNGCYLSEDGMLFNKNKSELVFCPEGKEGVAVVPAEVETMSHHFQNCSLLTEIIVSEDNAVYSSLDGVLYNKNKTELMYCPRRKEGRVAIPEGTIEIWRGAFDSCQKLTSMQIPSTLTAIDKRMFLYCTLLENIIVTLSPRVKSFRVHPAA